MSLKFIVGASGCGKTTLAQSIAGDDTIISLDAFSKSVRAAFLNFELYGKKVSVRPTVNCDVFLNLVSKYIECFISDYPNKSIIIEGCHFTPKEILSKFPDAKIAALGISDKTKVLSQINKREWMSVLDESVKLEYAKQIADYSLWLKDNADNYLYLELDANEEIRRQCLAYFAD